METLHALESHATVEVPADGSRLTLWRRAADPSAPWLLLLGLALAAGGFILIMVGWSATAGLSDVWRQVPYLISAGLSGLGLVTTGLVTVNVAVRRHDAAERDLHLAALTEAVRELNRRQEHR